MGVSAAVTMDTEMFIFCACAYAHIHCCLSIKWVDQGVVYPIRLSGLFSYPAWLRNKGVRIIEVLLYRGVPLYLFCTCTSRLSIWYSETCLSLPPHK